MDHERRDPINADDQARLLAYLEAAIPACDALLLSDYQKGLLGRDLIQRVVELARAHGKVSTGNLKPQGIGAHCAPDRDHAQPQRSERRHGTDAGREVRRGDAARGGPDAAAQVRRGPYPHHARRAGADAVHAGRRPGDGARPPCRRLRRGRRGRHRDLHADPGAGGGRGPAEAVTLANCAGAVVVRKVGVATASRDEILATGGPD